VRVYLNGEGQELAASSTLLDLVNQLHLPSTRIAIELNRTVVRRRDWEITTLSENSCRVRIKYLSEVNRNHVFSD
jgi:thiamine biosynthesis protein ThiS